MKATPYSLSLICRLTIFASVLTAAFSTARAETFTVSAHSAYPFDYATIVSDDQDDLKLVLDKGNASVDLKKVLSPHRPWQSIIIMAIKEGNSETGSIAVNIRRCGKAVCKSKAVIPYIPYDQEWDSEIVEKKCGGSPSNEEGQIELYAYCRGAFLHYESKGLLDWPAAKAAMRGWFKNSAELAKRRIGTQLTYFYARDDMAEEKLREIYLDSLKTHEKFRGHSKSYYEDEIRELDEAELEKISIADALVTKGYYHIALPMAYEAREAFLKLSQSRTEIINGVRLSDIENRIQRWMARAAIAKPSDLY